jgi:hypothetical protein
VQRFYVILSPRRRDSYRRASTRQGRSRTCSEGGASFPARQGASVELGIELDRQQETEATAEIFSDLGMEKELHPTAPLFEGKWA